MNKNKQNVIIHPITKNKVIGEKISSEIIFDIKWTTYNCNGEIIEVPEKTDKE